MSTKTATAGASGILSNISLRAIKEDDRQFLLRVYAETREWELAHVPDWSQAQKDTFIESQFSAQHQYYQTHYGDAEYSVIRYLNDDIGRLYVHRGGKEIRLMDIALLNAHRNKGIGTALTQSILDEAAASGCIVSLHVEAENPAKRLYERLGFRDVGEVTFYKRMHWAPAGLEETSAKIAREAQAQVKTAS